MLISHTSVNILVRDHDGRTFLQMRDGRALSAPLCWSFWGGAMQERDESAIHAAARELSEELGITAFTVDFEVAGERRSSNQLALLVLYRRPVDWGSIDIREGAGAGFFWKSEMEKLPLANAVRIHLEKDPGLFTDFMTRLA